ncbi:MAG: threonine ammonia-lyase, biosynthetic [bacterium]
MTSSSVPSFSSLVHQISSLPIYDVAIKSALDLAPILSERLGLEVLLKREDTQSVFSFKCRGAYAKMHVLGASALQKGVVAASAGNHAQGVALAAQKMQVPATIVMPLITPEIKVNAVKRLGARVILHGDIYDQACDYALDYCQQHGQTFIHPYDDWDVIAGQGTIAKEILEQCTQPIDAIFVPVGGGGLIAGILAYVKALKPEIKIIAVEPENSACLDLALKHAAPTPLDHVGIFAEGVAVKEIGQKPWSLIHRHIDDILLVDTDEICAAVKDIYDETRSIVEPAGALAVAGIKKYLSQGSTNFSRVVAINCGANLNFDRLRHISERADIGENREALFAIKIPEKPGSFRHFITCIGKRGITEFNYRFADPSQAVIFVGIALRADSNDKDQFLAILDQHGFPYTDLSHNEVAKLHLRYMVGGKATLPHPEKLYRFQFPEVPGALAHFLHQFADNWNISLFHYRNHGAAFGRVLAGFTVPEHDLDRFQTFLSGLDFFHFNESDNDACRLFL